MTKVTTREEANTAEKAYTATCLLDTKIAIAKMKNNKAPEGDYVEIDIIKDQWKCRGYIEP
jgi:hypothetical protein